MKLNGYSSGGGSLLRRKQYNIFVESSCATKSIRHPEFLPGIASSYQIRNFLRHCQKHQTRNRGFLSVLIFGPIVSAGLYIAYHMKDVDIRKNVTDQVQKVKKHHRSQVEKLGKQFTAYGKVKKESFTIRNTIGAAGDSETPLSWEEVSEKSLASIVKVESIKRPFLLNSLTLVLDQKIGFVCERGIILTDSFICERDKNNEFRITLNNGRILYGRIPFPNAPVFRVNCALIELNGGHDIPPLALQTDQSYSRISEQVIAYRLNDFAPENEHVVSSVRATLNFVAPGLKSIILHDGQNRLEQTPENVEPCSKSLADPVENLHNLMASINPLKSSVYNEEALSGSPVIDQNCNVVGIVRAGCKKRMNVLPVDHMKTFLKDFCSGPIPFSALTNIGIDCVPLNPLVRTTLSRLNNGILLPQVEQQTSGHLVCRVHQNSISHRCGIKPGDVITHVNNEPLHNIINQLILKLKSDGKIKVRVKRGEASEEIILKI